MSAVVHEKPAEVLTRLAALGLEEGALVEAVRRGQLAFLSCTSNHPPNFPGLAAWAETVAALREVLTPVGWRGSNDNNYALCVDPDGRIAIAVSTADEGTGHAEATPSTNARKGPRTQDAVTGNQLRFSFMDEQGQRRTAPPAGSDGARETWYLLIHHVATEVRCELSLPISMDEEGHITAWRERILLGAIPLDGGRGAAVPVPPPLPDIDVAVRRRA